MENQSECNISTWSDKIWAAIFLEVPSMFDRFYNIGQVCRKWRNCSRSTAKLWSNLKFTNRPGMFLEPNYLHCANYPTFLESAATSIGVTSMTLKIEWSLEWSLEFFEITDPKFSFVNCRFFECNFYLAEASVLALLACYPNLEFLSANAIHPQFFKMICCSSIGSTLQRLVLCDFEHDFLENVVECCAQVPQLRELSLRTISCRKLCSKTVGRLVEIVSTLEIFNCDVNYQSLVWILAYLSGQGNEWFLSRYYHENLMHKDVTFQLRLKFFPNSRQLDEFFLHIPLHTLEFADPFVSAAISSNAKSFESIRRLHLHRIDKESASIISAVCSKSLQSLQLLEVKMSNAMWSSCANLPQLTEFVCLNSFPNSDNIDSALARKHIAKLTLQLDHLECELVNFQTLISVISALPGQPFNWNFQELPIASFVLKFHPGSRCLKEFRLAFARYAPFPKSKEVFYRGLVDEFQSNVLRSKAELFQSIQCLKLQFIDSKTELAMEVCLNLQYPIYPTFSVFE